MTAAAGTAASAGPEREAAEGVKYFCGESVSRLGRREWTALFEGRREGRLGWLPDEPWRGVESMAAWRVSSEVST